MRVAREAQARIFKLEGDVRTRARVEHPAVREGEVAEDEHFEVVHHGERSLQRLPERAGERVRVREAWVRVERERTHMCCQLVGRRGCEGSACGEAGRWVREGKARVEVRSGFLLEGFAGEAEGGEVPPSGVACAQGERYVAADFRGEGEHSW